jgi:TonB family protein
MVAAVRPQARYDVDDPTVTVVASNAGTIPPAACDHPFEGARVIHAAEPDTPPMAQQQGIKGTVAVAVALDASGNVVSAAIQRSPSAVLNNAAIEAARRSTYGAAVVACKAVPSAYEFVLGFF